MVTYRYLGYAETDANGVAKYNFTGSGAGEIDYIASLDNPITDGSIVSVPCNVWDTKWYDLGTDSTNSMFGTSSTMTVNYGTEECTLTETESGTTGVVVTDSNHYIQPNDIFEFDFMQVDGSRAYAPIYIRNKSNGSSFASITLQGISASINTWMHLKCQIVGNVMNVYVDGATTPIERSMSGTDTDYRVYFNTPTDITTLKFKNFKVYNG